MIFENLKLIGFKANKKHKNKEIYAALDKVIIDKKINKTNKEIVLKYEI